MRTERERRPRDGETLEQQWLPTPGQSTWTIAQSVCCPLKDEGKMQPGGVLLLVSEDEDRKERGQRLLVRAG